jgi:hypothetical protein
LLFNFLICLVLATNPFSISSCTSFHCSFIHFVKTSFSFLYFLFQFSLWACSEKGLTLGCSAQTTSWIYSMDRAERAVGRLLNPEATPSCIHPGSCSFTYFYMSVLIWVTSSALSSSTAVPHLPSHHKALAILSSCVLWCSLTWSWSFSRLFQYWAICMLDSLPLCYTSVYNCCKAVTVDCCPW